MHDNAIYLRRRNKVILPTGSLDAARTLGAALSAFLAAKAGSGNLGASVTEALPAAYVASVAKNFEALGYALSPRLLDGLAALTLDELTAFYQDAFSALKRAKGAHKTHKPMYPNFPAQVMEASQVELYLNAILHYWTDGQYLPATEVRERLPLLDNVDLKGIDLGDQADFEALFTAIASSNSSLSEQDKADLTWFIVTYRDAIEPLLPDAIPQKESRAFLGAQLATLTTKGETFIAAFTATATDVLRLAVAISGGDVSLAENTRFTLTRPARRLLLGLLERTPNPAEDMRRHQGAWKRLAHELHAGEYATRFPAAFAAITLVRATAPIPTTNSAVERALEERDVAGALARLVTRPGDLARRLDHLLRLDVEAQDAVLAGFSAAAGAVSTPVLLQAMHHFKTRSAASPIRVFFPKGNTAKVKLAPNKLPALGADVCARVMASIESTLAARFAALPALGKVYVDPTLADVPVPHGGRSASKSLRPIIRGTRLPLPGAGDTVRFFIWWRDGADRTDLDLTAAFYDADFAHLEDISYYNLKTFGGHHSGDIVAAPKGASEFIDLDLTKVAARGVRYVAMMVNVYTGQLYSKLPECFAGWMMRDAPNSGEIYEPATVIDKMDVTAASKMVMPLLIDVLDRKVIWCDMGLRSNVNSVNNVWGNRTTIAVVLESMLGADLPNLRDLLSLHGAARGELVATADEADVVFSFADGLPFRGEEIAAQYMA